MVRATDFKSSNLCGVGSVPGDALVVRSGGKKRVLVLVLSRKYKNDFLVALYTKLLKYIPFHGELWFSGQPKESTVQRFDNWPGATFID